MEESALDPDIACKQCTVCRRFLPKTTDFFSRDWRWANTLRSVCKKCRSKQNRDWRESKRGAEDVQRWIKSRTRGARYRARQKGLDFDIDLNMIELPRFCPVLGLKLSYAIHTGKKEPSPNAASLDRIDSSKGYTNDNIQVISARANLLKNDASLEEMIKIFDYYVVTQQCRHPNSSWVPIY